MTTAKLRHVQLLLVAVFQWALRIDLFGIFFTPLFPRSRLNQMALFHPNAIEPDSRRAEQHKGRGASEQRGHCWQVELFFHNGTRGAGEDECTPLKTYCDSPLPMDMRLEDNVSDHGRYEDPKNGVRVHAIIRSYRNRSQTLCCVIKTNELNQMGDYAVHLVSCES